MTRGRSLSIWRTKSCNEGRR